MKFSPQGEVLVKNESSSASSAQNAIVRTSIVTYTTPIQKDIYIIPQGHKCWSQNGHRDLWLQKHPKLQWNFVNHPPYLTAFLDLG